MKNFVIISIIIIVIAVVMLFGLSNNELEKDAEIPSSLTKLFQEELMAEATERIGQPIEGFTAFMLVAGFEGLEERDFDGVEALEGVYSYDGDEKWGQPPFMIKLTNV